MKKLNKKKKINKVLTTLGTLTVISTPVIGAISCGSSTEKPDPTPPKPSTPWTKLNPGIPIPLKETTLTKDNAANYSSYDASTKTLTISNKPNDNVVGINTDAFQSYWDGSTQKDVTNLVLPDTLKTIGNDAFTKIGDYTKGAKLTTLTIPNSVTHIGERAFKSSSIKTLNFEGKVTSKTTGYLGDDAFGLSFIDAVQDNNWRTFLKSHYSGSFVIKISDQIPATPIPASDIFLDKDNAATYSTYDASTKTLTIANKNNKRIVQIGTDAFASYWDGAGKKDVEKLVLPDTLTDIGASAFTDSNDHTKGAKLTALTIPNSVTDIEDSAFSSSALTSLTLSSALTTIGDNAFSSATTDTLTIPDTVTSIGNNAFKSAQLTTLDIPNSVTTIGASAFEGSQLTSLTLGSKVKSIGASAFSSATISTLNLPPSITSIGASAFAAATITGLVIPDSVTTIGDSAFTASVLTSLTLSAALNTIGTGAFAAATITDLIIPGSVAVIGSNAFKSANLTNLSIPDSVTTIGDSAFEGSSLASLILGANIETIGSNAFTSAIVQTLDLPSSITSIGAAAFASVAITALTLPGSITSIGDNAFQNAQLTSLIIPASVTSIGASAFENSPLTALIFEGVTSQAQTTGFLAADTFKLTPLMIVTDPNWNSFLRTNYSSSFAADPERNIILTANNAAQYSNYDANTKKLTISNKNNDHITQIDTDAFASYWTGGTAKEVAQIELPTTLEVIGNNAFNGAKLTDLIIPASVTSIGASAFEQSALNTLTFEGPVKTEPTGFLGIDTFKATNLEAVKNTEWNNFLKTNYSNSFNPQPVNEIILTAANAAEYSNYDPATKKLTIHNNGNNHIVQISGGTFDSYWYGSNKKKVTQLELPNTVKKIESHAFVYTSNTEGAELTSLTIPDSVIEIGDAAFSISPLSQLTLGKNVTTIARVVFAAAKLTTLTIPDSVTKIGSYAFRNSPLTSLTFEGPVKTETTGFLAADAFSETPLSAIQGSAWKTFMTTNYRNSFKA